MFILLLSVINPSFSEEESLSTTKEKAEEGDPKAQLELADEYYTKQSYVVAIKWYKKSAEQGNMEAQTKLGAVYLGGLNGVAQNKQKADKWFKKAFAQRVKLSGESNPEEQYQLAIFYEKGFGTEKNYKKAIEWFTKSENQGYLPAKGKALNLTLKLMDEKGEVSFNVAEQIRIKTSDLNKEDYKNLVSLYNIASDKGHIKAQAILASMYYFGEGIPQDYKQALKLFNKAAERGDAKSQYNLSLMYFKGQGTTQDYAESFKWSTKAAEQGIGEAQLALAQAYYNGNGIPQNYKKAVKWYKKSAEQGITDAQNNLGVMYNYGIGTPQNYVKAYAWYSVASSQSGNHKNRDIVAKEMTSSQIEEAQKLSEEYYEKYVK